MAYRGQTWRERDTRSNAIPLRSACVLPRNAIGNQGGQPPDCTSFSAHLLCAGGLPGCQLFVKTNVPLANQGKPQVDLPPGYVWSPKPPVGAPFFILHSSFCLQYLLAAAFVSNRDTGRKGSPLRYRGSTRVPPYHHRSNTLAGRWAHRRSQNRLRFPCRSQPPRCRGAPVRLLGLRL
jgi:hypothetical protein